MPLSPRTSRRWLDRLEAKAPPAPPPPDPYERWLMREISWLEQVMNGLIDDVTEEQARAAVQEIARLAEQRPERDDWPAWRDLEHQDKVAHTRCMMVWTEEWEDHHPGPHYVDQYDRPDGRGVFWHECYYDIVGHATKIEIHPWSYELVSGIGITDEQRRERAARQSA